MSSPVGDSVPRSRVPEVPGGATALGARRLPQSVIDFDLSLVDVDPWAIHYSTYTEWMDRGLMHLLRAAGHPLHRILADGYGFPVVSCHLDCVSPVGLDDRIRLVTAVARLGRTSLTMSYRFTLLRPDAPEVETARGETVHVCVDRSTGRPRPLPAWLVGAPEVAGGTGGTGAG